MRVQIRHRHAKLGGVLEERSRRAQFADVVPAARVRPSQHERVVRRAVPQDVARLGVHHRHGRRAVGFLRLRAKLNEPRRLRREPVVNGKPASQTDALVEVEDVARADGRAVHETRRVARDTALREHDAVRARAAVRRGRTITRHRAAGAGLGAGADNRAGFVARRDFLQHYARGGFGLPREVLRDGRLRARAVDPDARDLLHLRPPGEHRRELARVEHARLEVGLVGVAVAQAVRVVVLEFESQVILRLQEVRRAHRAVQLAAPAVQVAVLEEHRAAGLDGHQIGFAALAGSDRPLQLALRGLHRSFAQHDVHLHFALVAVIRPRHDLDVVEQLKQEDVTQSRLRVLHVVQLANLEVVLALDHARVRASAVHGLHLVIQKHGFHARDLALDDVRDDVPSLHAVEVRDRAERQTFRGVVPLDDVLHRRQDAHRAAALLLHLRQHFALNLGRQRRRALDFKALHAGPDLLAEHKLHGVPVLPFGSDVRVHVREQTGVQQSFEVRGQIVAAHFVPAPSVQAAEEFRLGGNAGSGGEVRGEHRLDDEVTLLELAARRFVVVVVVVVVIIVVVVVVVFVFVVLVVVILVVVVFVVLVGVRGGDPEAAAAAAAASAGAVAGDAADASERHREQTHGLHGERGDGADRAERD